MASLWPGTSLRAGFAPQQASTLPRILDGLGEIRIEYDTALLDAVRASGLRGCVVTMGNPALEGPEAFESVRAEREAYEAHIDRHTDRLARMHSVADFDRAVERGVIGLLYYIQNATPLQSDVRLLETLRAWGIRIIQLTYNSRNLLGDGCLEEENRGLTAFGREVVARMNELRLLVDVSHSGHQTTLDAILASKQPVAVTHSGCKAMYDHPRNKSDEVLRALAESGGVIGIFQINPYLGVHERNTLDQYIAHIEHAVQKAGIDHVGIGSDREYRAIPDTPEEKKKLEDELSRLRPTRATGFRWPFFISELNHPRRMETIADALARRGYRPPQIDKILGGNFYRLFRETIG